MQRQAVLAFPPLLSRSFACCVSGVASSFLSGLQRDLAFGLFGRDESLDFPCFMLGLGNEFSSTGSLLGQFRVTDLFCCFALGNSYPARFVHRRSVSLPLLD